VSKIICGVDIAAATLFARVGRDGPTLEVPRSPEGLARLAAFCRDHRVALVALEATGGYERLPFQLLWAEGVPAALVNPRAVRRFAQAMGRLEKTDRLDAGLIAWYAAVKGLAPQPPPGPAQQRLAALVTRLRQLVELRTAQSHQRRQVSDPELGALSDALLALVGQQIREIEAKITGLLASEPLWQRLAAALRSIKGVAGRTVARLLAELPEIGTLSTKAVAKLAGLAPLACDSGQARGRRAVRGGRAGVRSILYVVVGVVWRYDPDFAAARQRLMQAGKPKKVIRTALARKLLVRLNARAREARQGLALGG